MDLSEHVEGEIPIPVTSAYVSGHGHNNIHGVNTPIHQHTPSNETPPTPTTATENHHQLHLHPINYSPHGGTKRGAGVKYRECLKNHAASIGGNATDGCGEFMPSGEEGTLEALKCSACGCHRNFHRKETEGDPDCFHGHPLRGQKGFLVSAPDAVAPALAGNSLIPRVIVPFAMQTSDEQSDEMEGGAAASRPPVMAKKRFRTKFTAEQKEKMLRFAERVEWRLQRQEEGVVQQFCHEIGVKRRVLKVWMHNNKRSLARKNSPPPPLNSIHSSSTS